MADRGRRRRHGASAGKDGHAVELAAHLGADRVDHALGLAAMAGRFADGDLAAICDHLASEGPPTDVVIADEDHSVQPGTSGWAAFGGEDSGNTGGSQAQR